MFLFKIIIFLELEQFFWDTLYNKHLNIWFKIQSPAMILRFIFTRRHFPSFLFLVWNFGRFSFLRTIFQLVGSQRFPKHYRSHKLIFSVTRVLSLLILLDGTNLQLLPHWLDWFLCYLFTSLIGDVVVLQSEFQLHLN